MTTEIVTIAHDETFGEAAPRISDTRFAFYPIVGDDARLEAIVSWKAIDDAVHEGRTGEAVRVAAEEPKLVATADDLLIDVVRQMQMRDVDRCPVIDSHTTRRVVGFLSPSDILRTRMRHAALMNDESFDIFA